MGKQGQIRIITSQSGMNREGIGLVCTELGKEDVNRIFKNMSLKMPQRGVEKPSMQAMILSSSGMSVNCERSRDVVDNYKQSDRKWQRFQVCKHERD
ncbi:hypothetical protein CPB84DRAFT_1761366 [Gymnopilus junonius]|uniref:Uncharacterized protein n=1 Tax=Gymnopilus junonius TaxID=109634 RepID=A0A9P5P2Q0_GYMJU|nr:hypothetical protein CPB84DRAFT_1761366 [Gymnopilus junonius]